MLVFGQNSNVILNRMKEPVILLTACINPNGMAYTVLQNSEERLRQYRKALDWYLAHVMNKIVFVENTGYDISPFYEIYIESGQLEVITFQGNDFDKSKGKGYGEALMIEYAIKNSKFLKGGAFVVKITGRLVIENFKELIHAMKSSECIFASLVRGKYGMERKSFFFGAPTKFLTDYFLSDKDKINDNAGVYFENHLFNKSLEWVKDGGKAKEFKRPILVNGISGSNGEKYPTEQYPYLKAWLRYYLHKLPIYK